MSNNYDQQQQELNIILGMLFGASALLGLFMVFCFIGFLRDPNAISAREARRLEYANRYSWTRETFTAPDGKRVNAYGYIIKDVKYPTSDYGSYNIDGTYSLENTCSRVHVEYCEGGVNSIGATK